MIREAKKADPHRLARPHPAIVLYLIPVRIKPALPDWFPHRLVRAPNGTNSETSATIQGGGWKTAQRPQQKADEMLLTQLEHFVALAKERHFGKAAEACHIGQSALSESIHKLEVELGVRLVRREHSFEGVTAEGEQLLVWARRIIADQTSLRDAAQSLSVGLSGILRVGAVPSATTSAVSLV